MSIPLSLSDSMDISHSSAMQLMLLFYSSITALPISRHLIFLFLTLTPWPPFALIFLFCTSQSIFFPWELLPFAFHSWIFLRNLHPSIIPSLCLFSLFSSPFFSLCLARKSSFPPWAHQTPVWVLEENWSALLALLESPNRTNPPPNPPWTESCPSR